MPNFTERPHEPKVVEARRVEGSPREVYAIAEWCDSDVKTRVSRDGKALTPCIEVYEECPWCRDGSVSEANLGDWIVKYPNGCFEVWTPSRFKKWFAPVDPTD